MINLDWIAQQEYLGRGFILGRTQDERDFASYFVTGRSPSSRERKFVDLKNGTVKTFPTNLKTSVDPEKPLTEKAKQEIRERGGNPSLLVYSAIRVHRGYKDMFVVSNGAQTDHLFDLLKELDDGFLSNITDLFAEFCASPFIVDDIDLTSYEPDNPNYTPRISGVITPQEAAIAIFKRTLGKLERQVFSFELAPGFGKFISTYTGQNVQQGVVIPSFRGEPLDIEIEEKSIEEITGNLYAALGPKLGPQYLSPGEDFRVGVVTALRHEVGEKPKPFIINRG
ncbi:hypothetical protein HYV88_01320 [Candidatus Woesearchaeota archaeon]|nr:hypothetical protein [Candidatus Woesearchaeota archaeon]